MDATLAHIWCYFGISLAILDRSVCHTLVVWYFMGDMHSFSMYYVIIVLLRYFSSKEAKIGQTKYLETTRR